ncbi:hypothetical protein CR513_48260, partial [Mucuna pruriens]
MTWPDGPGIVCSHSSRSIVRLQPLCLQFLDLGAQCFISFVGSLMKKGIVIDEGVVYDQPLVLDRGIEDASLIIVVESKEFGKEGTSSSSTIDEIGLLRVWYRCEGWEGSERDDNESGHERDKYNWVDDNIHGVMYIFTIGRVLEKMLTKVSRDKDRLVEVEPCRLDECGLRSVTYLVGRSKFEYKINSSM